MTIFRCEVAILTYVTLKLFQGPSLRLSSVSDSARGGTVAHIDKALRQRPDGC